MDGATERGPGAAQGRGAIPHAECAAADRRADPVDVLEAQAESRVPELLPIRYGRMAESPFAFLPRRRRDHGAGPGVGAVTGLRVQACGDAHVSNFGKFATPGRNMIFDINDFDETLPGPWEWDVKRSPGACTSSRTPARFHPAKRDGSSPTMVRAYRSAWPGHAELRTLEVWYHRGPTYAMWSNISSEVPADAEA